MKHDITAVIGTSLVGWPKLVESCAQKHTHAHNKLLRQIQACVKKNGCVVIPASICAQSGQIYNTYEEAEGRGRIGGPWGVGSREVRNGKRGSHILAVDFLTRSKHV